MMENDEHRCRFAGRDSVYCNEAIRRSKGCDRCGWNPEAEKGRIDRLHGRKVDNEDHGKA